MAVTTTSAPFQQTAMPAVDLRQLFGTMIRVEGVRTSADLAVAQRAAGANMSVDVAAGSAAIQDDHGTGGGFYAYTLSATSNVAVTGSDPTNPRVDRVVIRVRDQALGDAANDAAPVVVAGTPTSGATLANLNGAAAVPGSSLLLANILIPATATSVTTANIDTTVRRLAGGMVTGSVTAAGAVTAGTGFTSTKSATGSYTLTFTPGFTAAPVLLVLPAIAPQFRGSASTGSAATVETFNGTGTSLDSAFSFVAIAMV